MPNSPINAGETLVQELWYPFYRAWPDAPPVSSHPLRCVLCDISPVSPLGSGPCLVHGGVLVPPSPRSDPLGSGVDGPCWYPFSLSLNLSLNLSLSFGPLALCFSAIFRRAGICCNGSVFYSFSCVVYYSFLAGFLVVVVVPIGTAVRKTNAQSGSPR